MWDLRESDPHSAATQTPPTPEKLMYAEAATQSTTQKPVPYNSGCTNTEPAAATQPPKRMRKQPHRRHPRRDGQKGETGRGRGRGRGKGKEKENEAPATHRADTNHSPACGTNEIQVWSDASMDRGRQPTGVQVPGIRWLTQEHRRVGKLASSLVIYLKGEDRPPSWATYRKETLPNHGNRLEQMRG